MNSHSAARCFALSLLLACGGLSGAVAQDAGVPDEQKPPAEQTEQPKCVTSNTAWREKGKAATFEIELVNTCGARLKCTVDAFVTGSRGQAQGHGSLVLAPASKDQPTRKIYAMAVKSAGGMANVSHSCKAI